MWKCRRKRGRANWRPRAFCFYGEIEFLIKNGLIKAGSRENAVVIRDDAVLTTEPLRTQRSSVRQDPRIVGEPGFGRSAVCAHIVAIKPSHSTNCGSPADHGQMRRPLIAANVRASARASTEPAKGSALEDFVRKAAAWVERAMKILRIASPF